MLGGLRKKMAIYRGEQEYPQAVRKYIQDTLLESRRLLEKPVTAQDESPKRWLTQVSFEGSN